MKTVNNLEKFKKRNPQISIYLMQHINRIRCDNLSHWNEKGTIILRHKKLCKDGKYRGIQNAPEYCGKNLIEKRNRGDMIPFSSSELKDLEELLKNYNNQKRGK